MQHENCTTSTDHDAGLDYVGSLRLYVEHRVAPCGFLCAVLTNDLQGAFAKADDKNRQRMLEIVRYVYNELPSECWGSKEKVKTWLVKERKR